MASPRCILLICMFACVLSSTFSWPHHHPDHDESENELDAEFDVNDEEFPDDKEFLGIHPKSVRLEDGGLGAKKNYEDEKVEPGDEQDLEIDGEDTDDLNKDGVNEDDNYKSVRDDEEISVEDAKEIYQWLKELDDEKHDTSDEEVFGREFEEWVRKIIDKVKDEDKHTTEAEWGIF